MTIFYGFVLVHPLYHCGMIINWKYAMKEVHPISDNTIYEFDLVLNSTHFAAEQALNFYGILVLPALLGSTLLYHHLGLRAAYLLIALVLLFLVLVNLYFFNERKLARNKQLRLLIDGQFLQILNSQKVYLHQRIHDLVIVYRYVGQYPTLDISGADFPSLYISYYRPSKSVAADSQLRQPDYWIKKKRLWEQLCRLMKVH